MEGQRGEGVASAPRPLNRFAKRQVRSWAQGCDAGRLPARRRDGLWKRGRDMMGRLQQPPSAALRHQHLCHGSPHQLRLCTMFPLELLTILPAQRVVMRATAEEHLVISGHSVEVASRGRPVWR
ncbi:uncharacterized protein LOC124590644 isoform X2 [Schistocerca americana]|uniref:uncharacterized protein LOC124590644 isoform X2 n=1 Tax=Schistocerca americana TaxID=7009 RepID=UPI001F4F6202|nr:uncharacterized protein LOC124590644 isoform X2 [Schistocerca americana]